MINIGITGTLSSGKSTVAKLISGGKYPLFSADKSVKNLYTKKFFIKKIKKKFNIKNTKGVKQRIKSIIKNDKKKLKELELIVHPLVRKEMRVFLKKKGKIKIFEIPLLIESKLNKHFDLIVNIAAQKKLRLNDDQVYSNIHKYGNTTAASIPIALSEALSEGRISKGDQIIFASFGSGFTWASSLMKW